MMGTLDERYGNEVHFDGTIAKLAAQTARDRVCSLYANALRNKTAPTKSQVAELIAAAVRGDSAEFTVDGIIERAAAKCRSRKKSRYYEALLLRVHAGEVLYFLRHVNFDLPGGGKYRVDFVEFRQDGTVVYVDVKGMRTKQREWIQKMIVETLYPIQIVEA